MDVVSGSAEVQKERVGKIEHTRRSISPGYRLWSAILLHDAGVCCWLPVVYDANDTRMPGLTPSKSVHSPISPSLSARGASEVSPSPSLVYS